MKHHHQHDCSCHAHGLAAKPASTGFFVLALSLSLLLCGLITTGVIPLRLWW